MFALTNCQIYTGLQTLTQHAVIIQDDKIVKVCRESELPTDIVLENLNNAFVSPGCIDIQLNGCGGVQFNETLENLSIATIDKMQQTSLLSGCTSFLPTLITSSDEFMRKAVEVMHEYNKTHQNEALGLHLEGPYINPKKKGIHNESFIRKPDATMIQFLANNASVIKVITLAPEQVEPHYIQQLTEAGIYVSIGHTNASYDEARIGFNSGIRLATHLYNAMSATVGRAPNAVGAIYDEPEVYCGIIADGLHVDYANIRNSYRIKRDKLILVTDASLAVGTNMSEFSFGGKRIFYRDGKCFGEDGTLAGSGLTMIEAVKNTVEHVGLPLDEALRMATLYPAKAIGVDSTLGTLTPGKVANIMVFDKDYSVIKTFVNGKMQ